MRVSFAITQSKCRVRHLLMAAGVPYNGVGDCSREEFSERPHKFLNVPTQVTETITEISRRVIKLLYVLSAVQNTDFGGQPISIGSWGGHSFLRIEKLIVAKGGHVHQV